MSFPEYSAYKDTRVEWLGEVPAHWDIGSFRRLIKSVSNGTTIDQIDETESTIAVSRIETISTGEINFEKVGHVDRVEAPDRFLLNDGDILFSHINSLPMVGNVALYRGGRSLLHGMNLLRIQPRNDVSSDWIFYWLKSKNIRQEVESRAKPAINQASISTDSVRAIPALIPPKNEQTQIARFLDHETARIDALIEEQQRLIELLKEKRQAVISHAVTKGLDPTVPMKDSGVEWLGEVPAHWDVKKLGYLGEAIIGLTYSPDDVADDGVLVLRSSNVQQGKLSFLDNVYVQMKVPSKLMVRFGDILICSRNGSRDLIGKNAFIDESAEGMSFGAFMTIFRSSINDFLLQVFNSNIFMAQAGSFMTSTVNQLTTGNLNSLIIPVPPRTEQISISSHLTSVRAEFENLISQALAGIQLLQERRSALISAAVTGKIDVRGWQPPASTHAPELDQEAV